MFPISRWLADVCGLCAGDEVVYGKGAARSAAAVHDVFWDRAIAFARSRPSVTSSLCVPARLRPDLEAIVGEAGASDASIYF